MAFSEKNAVIYNTNLAVRGFPIWFCGCQYLYILYVFVQMEQKMWNIFKMNNAKIGVFRKTVDFPVL